MNAFPFFQKTVRVVVVASLFFLAGCFDNALTFSIRFADVMGLNVADSVYFDQNVIGQVEKVSYTKKGDFLVEVTIAPEFTEAVTNDSTFFIVPAPGSTSAMAIQVEQERPGGQVLEKGAVVQGGEWQSSFDKMFGELQAKAKKTEGDLSKAFAEWKKSYTASAEQWEQELAATVEELSQQFDTFTEELGNLPDSQEVQQLEESVSAFAKEFAQAGKQMQEKLREEVLPRLREELDRLRKQLEREGRGQELKKIDEQITELEEV